VPVSEVSREQEYIGRLYERVDRLRDEASARLALALRQDVGTAQSRLDRDAAVFRQGEQLARLDAAEDGLCFGRLDLAAGERRHIGRIGLRDESGEGEPLLIDWRAPAARAFYVATAVAPHGIRRRRHITMRGRRVTAVDDEVLDRGELAGASGLAGEGALLAALEATRTGRMRDIVGTLQAEQDAVIRSPHAGILVVQGGPGTGKTAVALHRAAYLLYTHRHLAGRGVLVVGPSPVFLGYISQVLPGLGETSVLLRTVGELFPGVAADRAEERLAEEVKGRAMMAEVVAAAVRDRQAAGPAEFEFGGETLRLAGQVVASAAMRARASRLPHNQARPLFQRQIIAALAERYAEAARELADRLEADVADVVAGAREAIEADLASLPEVPGSTGDEEPDLAEVRRELRADRGVRARLDDLWPSLTPQRLLEELFADPARIARAAPGLAAAERAALRREPGGWTAADVPLLDEAAELLGQDQRAARARSAREQAQRVAYAQGVLDIAAGSRDPGEEVLSVGDLLDASELAARHEDPDYRTMAERAGADRTWTFGHVIVDEAQELSPMAWRLLARRCPARSMTIVGDVAQTGGPAGTTSWERVLEPLAGDRWRLARLTVNYRTPAEIMAATADLLAAIDPGQQPPQSVRETGTRPWRMALTSADALPVTLAEVTAQEAASAGQLAVIVPDARVRDLGEAVSRAAPGVSFGDRPDLTSEIVLLGARQAKGLEFDSVLIADPAAILAASPRGRNDLYVAMTRSTQRLGVLHPGPPPAELAALPAR